jgi:hypothetical protein
MAKQQSKSGGGITSKNNVTVPVRTGKSAYGINPGAVSQLGESIGNHATQSGNRLSYKGEVWRDGKTPAGGGVPLGNQLSNNVGKGGPGAGRQVMSCGSQGQHGSANPGQPTPGASKPIFPGFK